MPSLFAPGQVRLAPLYDVASVLPYREINIARAKLATKLRGDYRLRNIYKLQWRKLAQQLRVDPEAFISRVDSIARQLIDLVPEVRRRIKVERFDHPIFGALAKAIPSRTAKCRLILESSGAEGTLS